MKSPVPERARPRAQQDAHFKRAQKKSARRRSHIAAPGDGRAPAWPATALRRIFKPASRLALLIALLAVAFTFSGCVSNAPQVRQVEFGRSIFSDGQRRAGVQFQDGAQAIAVTGGTLWLFGDTFIGPPQITQITGMVGTTIAFLPATKTNLPPELRYFTDQNGVAANPLALFDDEPAATNRMWPLGGITVGGRVYLYYSMIEKTAGPGPWNFRSAGGGLAVADKPLQQFSRLRPGGRWKFPIEPIQVLHEGGHVYLFELSGEPRGLILGRVRASQIEDPAAYEFFMGGGWSRDRGDAKIILREAYGQVSVIRHPGGRGWLMVTSSDFFHAREIELRQSGKLEGPWSAPVRIAVPDMPGKTTQLIYGTFFHPELTGPGSRRLVLTFCRMLKGEWELTNPEWVTLTLAP